MPPAGLVKERLRKRVMASKGVDGHEEGGAALAERRSGADVRAANLRGQILGDDDFDWSKVDPHGEIVLKPNLPTNLDSNAFDGIDVPS